MSQPNMNTAEANQAPACFGAPSCYAGDSKICQACVAYGQCGSEVTETLVRIKNVINVDDLLHKHTQALDKARATRKAKEKVEKDATKGDELVKPARPMPREVQRKSKVEPIVYEIDEQTSSLIATLPVKAQPFAIQLCKTGMINRIKADLKNGLNPLEKTGPKFLSLALASLINGGFAKASLRASYVSEFSWGENTAASHVSLVVKLFAMFEIAVETDNKFVVNPELLEQSN